MVVLINVRDGKRIEVGKVVHQPVVHTDLEGRKLGEEDQWFRVDDVQIHGNQATLTTTTAYAARQKMTVPVQRQGKHIVVLVPD